MSNKAASFRRVIYWLIGLGAVIAAVVYAIRPVPVLVDTAIASRGPMEVTIDEDGITRIRERYVVSTPLTGRLLRITFDVGDSVSAAETVVARMEPTDPTLLDPREFARAKARVRAAERKHATAKSDFTKAQDAVNFAESEMGRIRKLREKNAASELEFAEKELEFRQRSEDARAAGFAIDIAEYELDLEKAALLLTDPDAPSESSMELAIKAPIDGRILRIYQESTVVVTGGSPLMEIGDPADLEIVADVLSRDAVRILPGAAVRLENWGGEQPLAGRVRLVEPSGFTKLSALGVEEQRVNAIIDLVDPPQARPKLGDNFRVDCRIVVWRSEDVLQIPTSSLFRVDGQWTVFTVVDNMARETTVQIGQNNGQQAEVIAGVDVGTPVIVHPGDSIQDGVGIEPR